MVEQKFFAGKRQKGCRDPTFHPAINDKSIVLVSTSLGNALSGFATGLWVTPPNFKCESCHGLFVHRDSSVP
jgi:hypothetical protein